MSAPSSTVATVMRVPCCKLLAALVLLQWAPRAWAQCRGVPVARLGALEGVIAGSPAGAKVCGWHVFPGMWLHSIEFWTRNSSIQRGDLLDFSVHHASSLRMPVARFSDVQPLRPNMLLTGSKEVLLELYAEHNNTYFEIAYRCTPSGYRFGPHYLSPAAYISIVLALVLLAVLVCMLPIYVTCYIRAKWSQERAIQGSRLMSLNDLQLQQRPVTAAVVVAELRTVGALQALPTQAYHGRAWEEPEDCCLCLEKFEENASLRVLPCSHYFHQECIDNWFTSRRFLPRTCPLCKRDPVPNALQGHDAALEVAAATVLARGAGPSTANARTIVETMADTVSGSTVSSTVEVAAPRETAPRSASGADVEVVAAVVGNSSIRHEPAPAEYGAPSTRDEPV